VLTPRLSTHLTRRAPNGQRIRTVTISLVGGAGRQRARGRACILAWHLIHGHFHLVLVARAADSLAKLPRRAHHRKSQMMKVRRSAPAACPGSGFTAVRPSWRTC